MKVKYSFYVLFIVFIGLASCGPSKQAFERLIPSDAAAVAVIQNPESALAAVNDFVNSIGVGAILGGDVTNLLKNQFSFDIAKFREGFDTSKPAVLTMSLGLGDIPSLVLLLPVKNIDKANSLIKEMVPSELAVAEGPFDGYLVVHMGTGLTYPPKESIAEGVIQTYTDESISVYVKFDALKKLPGFTFPFPSESENPMMAKLGSFYVKMFDSIDWLNYTLSANKELAALKGFVSLKKDSAMYKTFNVATKPVEEKSMLKTENMIDLVYDTTAYGSAEIADYIGSMVEMFGVPSDDIKKIVSGVKAYAKTLKGSGFASLNFNVPDKSVPNIELELVSSQPVTDAKLASDEIIGLQDIVIPLLNSYLKSFMETMISSDLEQLPDLSFKVKDLGDEKVGDVSVKGFQYSVESSASDANLDTNLSIINSMLETSFQTLITTSGNQLLVSTGNKSKEVLEKLLKAEHSGSDLSSNKEAKAAFEYLDKNPQAIVHINVNKIINQADSSFKLDETKTGVLASMTFGSGDKSTFSAVVKTQDLKDWLSLFMRSKMGGLQ